MYSCISVEQIQKTVVAYFGLRQIEMHSRRRSRSVARPRQIAMALASELTLHSLPEIGKQFGDRDRTTVTHAIKTIERLCRDDAALKQHVETIRAQLAV
jgi:chromosomal replication initiator protein